MSDVYLFCCVYDSSFILYSIFFFFNDTATTEIYTLSLHDALPISLNEARRQALLEMGGMEKRKEECRDTRRDRKSTRLNSSHLGISYAVFCLKKKKKKKTKKT